MSKKPEKPVPSPIELSETVLSETVLSEDEISAVISETEISKVKGTKKEAIEGDSTDIRKRIETYSKSVTGQKRFEAVAPFELLEKVGEGGMGIVYRARDKSLKREVAIKRLNKMLPRDEQLKKVFRTEAVITGRLSHPNVVPVHGIIDNMDELAIAMKYIGGRTLSDLIHPKGKEKKKTSLEWELDKKVEILIAVCNAVSFAHSLHIIHRDIKPANIMVGEFGEILLLDWGLAMSIAETPEQVEVEGVPHKSALSGLEGSLYYMPWEMFDSDGDHLCAQTDVYLLGACLHEIITGFPPHTNRRRQAVVAKNKDAISSISTAVEGELRDICLKALEPEIENRYSTAKAFQDALTNYLSHGKSRSACRAAQNLLAKAEEKAKKSIEWSHRTDLYDLFAGAIYGFAHALDMWPENEDAKQGAYEAKVAYALTARRLGDFGLALFQLDDLEGTEIDCLRGEISSLSQESRQSLRARTLAKRAAITAAVLIAVCTVMVFYVFWGASSGGKQVAVKTKQRLEDAGKERLLRIVENTSENINSKKQLVETTLQSFSNSLERVLLQGADGRSLVEQKPVIDLKEEHDEMARRRRIVVEKERDAPPESKPPDRMGYTLPALEQGELTNKQIQRLDDLVPALKRIIESAHPYVFRFKIGLHNTKLLAVYPNPKILKLDEDPTQRDWYRAAKEKKGIYHVSPHIDRKTGRIVTTTTIPLWDESGKMFGAAAVETYLGDILGATILPKEWGEHTKTEIVRIDSEQARNKMLVLFSMDSTRHSSSKIWRVGTDTPPLEPPTADVWLQMKEDKKNARSGLVEMARIGVPMYVGYSPLKDEDAQVMISVPKASMSVISDNIETGIIDHTEEQLWHLAKIVAIVFALALAVILVVTRKITHPY